MFQDLKFPANAMMIIEQMIKLSSFDLIPTEIIDAEIYYWPEMDAFSVNFEMSGVESVLLLSNIGFAIYMIYMHLFAMLVHACLHKARNAGKLVPKIHSKLGSYLYWDGINRFFMELFFDLIFLSILNLYMVDWDTPFSSVKFSNYFTVFILVLTSGVLVFYIIKFYRQPRNQRVRNFSESFGPLLEGTDRSARKIGWHLMLWPILFFVKRLSFVIILVVTNNYLWV